MAGRAACPLLLVLQPKPAPLSTQAAFQTRSLSASQGPLGSDPLSFGSRRIPQGEAGARGLWAALSLNCNKSPVLQPKSLGGAPALSLSPRLPAQHH